jgi:hypothetical protein
MGKQSVKDEVIVDLYCGVGYYTIPFLLHGKAAHVHACGKGLGLELWIELGLGLKELKLTNLYP